MLPVAVRGGRRLACPNCGKNLLTVLTDGVEVDACAACSGVWVDFIDERALLRTDIQSFSVDELKRLRRIYEPLGKVDPVRYRKCPICEELMYRRNWGGHSGVVVDRCEKHGHWYDADEVEKIREYVALGGVEYEKFAHADRGLAELNAKFRNEVSRLGTQIITERHKLTRFWAAVSSL